MPRLISYVYTLLEELLKYEKKVYDLTFDLLLIYLQNLSSANHFFLKTVDSILNAYIGIQ